jgi:hypothetical protein
VTPRTPGLKPELLVYDATGRTLQSFAEPGSDGSTSIILTAGATYKVVVGSHDGNSTGNYSLVVTQTSSVTVSNPGNAAVASTGSGVTTGASAGTSTTGIGAALIVPLDVTSPTAGPFTQVTSTTSRPKVVNS